MKSPKEICPFISHISKAPSPVAAGHTGAKALTTALPLHHFLCCLKTQTKTNPSKSDSATRRHAVVLPEDIAQVLAVQAARLLSFVRINVLGNHTEELLNLMAQTITKQNYMNIFKMMGL